MITSALRRAFNPLTVIRPGSPGPAPMRYTTPGIEFSRLYPDECDRQTAADAPITRADVTGCADRRTRRGARRDRGAQSRLALPRANWQSRPGRSPYVLSPLAAT